MSTDDITERIMVYIRERFLSGDLQLELEESTPLLDWGVLNSMNTALLLMFIRDELGVAVPPREVNARNFKDVGAITKLVDDLARAQQTTAVGTESKTA